MTNMSINRYCTIEASRKSSSMYYMYTERIKDNVIYSALYIHIGGLSTAKMISPHLKVLDDFNNKSTQFCEIFFFFFVAIKMIDT